MVIFFWQQYEIEKVYSAPRLKTISKKLHSLSVTTRGGNGHMFQATASRSTSPGTRFSSRSVHRPSAVCRNGCQLSLQPWPIPSSKIVRRVFTVISIFVLKGGRRGRELFFSWNALNRSQLESEGNAYWSRVCPLASRLKSPPAVFRDLGAEISKNPVILKWCKIKIPNGFLIFSVKWGTIAIRTQLFRRDSSDTGTC